LHVWLVRDSRLVSVERDAPSLSVRAALDALSQGPTADELAAGLRSALPAAAKVTLLGSPPGVAVLELGEDMTAITGQEQVLAIAQLVLTTTESPAVTAVEFVVSGQQVDVPLSDGTLSTGTVRRSDYAALIA
jgi:spore germination protein GerM